VAETLTIETLEGWAQAGAHWRVVHHGEWRAVVELRQCTGELVERLESGDPAVIAYLEGVESDLDLDDTAFAARRRALLTCAPARPDVTRGRRP
jgi:hypothetical protein